MHGGKRRPSWMNPKRLFAPIMAGKGCDKFICFSEGIALQQTRLPSWACWCMYLSQALRGPALGAKTALVFPFSPQGVCRSNVFRGKTSVGQHPRGHGSNRYLFTPSNWEGILYMIESLYIA